VAYSSSKAAIISLTKYIAMCVAEFGMRTSILSFGGVFNNWTMDFLNNNKALTTLNRME
jgi:NAD(P)-dependent dehydrogenase (short-subunit alcohol dehydrogenase family)